MPLEASQLRPEMSIPTVVQETINSSGNISITWGSSAESVYEEILVGTEVEGSGKLFTGEFFSANSMEIAKNAFTQDNHIFSRIEADIRLWDFKIDQLQLKDAIKPDILTFFEDDNLTEAKVKDLKNGRKI